MVSKHAIFHRILKSNIWWKENQVTKVKIVMKRGLKNTSWLFSQIWYVNYIRDNERLSEWDFKINLLAQNLWQQFSANS